MSKYIIWDKVSQVITPIGEVLTPEEWMDRYPIARISGIDLVLAGDTPINGAICNEYESFVSIYAQQGCDFTGCTTRQEFLDRIEQFEIEEAERQAQEAANYVSDEERTANALEDLVVLTELAQEA